jgi:hypothetical protein
MHAFLKLPSAYFWKVPRLRNGQKTDVVIITCLSHTPNPVFPL